MSSAWESDLRPVQPCVLCSGVPDDVVELPDLDEVHVAFASTALCNACAVLARAGDSVQLGERARDRWTDDSEVVPDVVRLVMAWAGHRMPADAAVAEPYRHVEMLPLSDEDRTLWRRLEPLIFDGPAHRVTVHGRVRCTVDGETSVVEVFRDGPRSRLIGEDGQPWLVSDGLTTWRRDEDGMVASPYDGESWAGQGIELAARRTREDVEAFGFGTPIGPIEPVIQLGRAAWKFRFAAPSHKPFDMAVVVDDETGLVLEKRFGDHSVAEWTAFDSDAQMSDELFTWAGPTRTRAELQSDRLQDHERDMAARAAWFADNVTPLPLEFAGTPADVTLHDWEDDGSFEASFDAEVTSGALARRPRTDSWWNLGWSKVSARWSDDGWDWALAMWDAFDESQPAEHHIRTVQTWLSSGPGN